jgi:hypothetical protein
VGDGLADHGFFMRRVALVGAHVRPRREGKSTRGPGNRKAAG